jgi:hypothetical protein
MTPQEHQTEHIRLHRALDQLLACYLSENCVPCRRTSIHDEILDLLKWSHDKTLLPSPLPEDADAHSAEPRVFSAQSDDPELLEWMARATDGGGFISSLAHAGLVADCENYPLIRVLLMAMRRKYPAYEPSEQVKQEIRERK